MRQRFADISVEWSRYKDEMHALLEQDVAALNRQVKKSGIPAVIVPPGS